MVFCYFYLFLLFVILTIVQDKQLEIMSIALFITGTYPLSKDTKANIKKIVKITGRNNVHIFLSLWKQKGQEIDYSNFKFLKNISNEFLSIEDIDNPYLYSQILYLSKCITNDYSLTNIISTFYRLLKCKELKENIEIKNNKLYSTVIHLSTNLYDLYKIDTQTFHQCTENTIYTSLIENLIYDYNFFYSSSIVFSKISEILLHISDIFEKTKCVVDIFDIFEKYIEYRKINTLN